MASSRRGGGKESAIGSLLVFLFNGSIQELVFSGSADGGDCGSAIYSILQGAELLVERNKLGWHAGLGPAWQGRLFT